MKKLIYLLMAFTLVFTTACDPMEDVYDEIGESDNTIVGDAVYTVSDDDYDDLGLTYGSFNSVEEVKEMLPPILTAEYPVWGKSSSVLVEYNLYIGSAFGIENYNLTEEDYSSTGSDLLGFKSDQVPGDYLPEILANNISDADEGDYVIAKYSQYTGDAYTVTPTVSLEENFDYGDAAGDLLTVSGGTWLNHSGTTNQLMYDTTSLTMTDYPSTDVAGSIMLDAAGSEDVSTFIAAPVTSGTMYASTLINISVVGDGTYSFHFADDSYGYSARVGAKTDGSGGILFGIGATSSSLTYGETSFDLNTTYLLVSSYNIDNGAANLYILTSPEDAEPSEPEATSTGDSGKTVARIALRQGGGGPTAKLDGIRVANTWSAIMSNDNLPDETIGDKEADKASYTFEEGVWEPTGDNFYELTSDDYDSMGEASGQPGKYNNFDSSMSPDDYISTYLSIKYPYAAEEDQLDIAYNYYSSGVQQRGNRYTYTNGVWEGHTSVIVTTLQFGQDGTTWVPDNTIKYTFTTADYDSLGEEYGDPGYYDNYDVREGKENYASPEVILADINTILMSHFPGMTEGQKFSVDYNVYSGISEVWTMNVILVGNDYVLQD